MDSFLSGFSNNYEGTQIGQGYTGNASVTGNFASANVQGVDVTQLQPGDTFQGEIVSVNGEDVQIQLTNGQYMAAKLERDVQLVIGQLMNLQVQSNKDNRIVLKPIYDSKMQMLRVGESALRAANMAVNDRTLTLVSTLIENGMSINKNTLMMFNRLTLQNPAASVADLIQLNKLQLPVNDNSIIQLQNYQNMNHKLLDGINTASDEILKLYDTLTGKADVQGNPNGDVNIVSDTAQKVVLGQAALENGGKFMEQVLVLLAGEEEQNGEMSQAMTNGMNSAAASQEGQEEQNSQSVQNEQNQSEQSGQTLQSRQNVPDMQSEQNIQGKLNSERVLSEQTVQSERSHQAIQNEQNVQREQKTQSMQNEQNIQDKQNGQSVQIEQNIQSKQNGQLQTENGVQNNKGMDSQTTVVKNALQEQTEIKPADDRIDSDRNTGQLSKQEEVLNQNTQKNVHQENSSLDRILNQLSGEKPQTLPNKIVSLLRENIKDGTFDFKDLKRLLIDSDLAKQLTTEQKAIVFRSEPFKSMLKNGLQRQWTLTPQELTQEGRVEEFYQKLAKESSQLTRMMNEAMQASGQSSNGTQARAMGNINENVEFINQINQMFHYVQLPLKLSNSQAHGDLYVYTNKKNMARKDGLLTAFLHLDMDNLGSLDVSISLASTAMQTERNQVTTKFYLDEDSITLVERHIDELAQRLSKKGYQCKSMILEKEEDKTVLEHIAEQVAGQSAVLSYQTFDTRA